MLMAFATGILLTGCGDGGSSEEPEAPVNILRVKGGTIDKTIVIDPEKLDYTFLAEGNQPISLMMFQPKINQSVETVFIGAGWLLNSQYAFFSLILPEKNSSTGYKVACNKDCEHSTRYFLSREYGKDILTFDINQQAVYSKLPVPMVDVPLLADIPVQFAGRLRFSFPQGWPVFQRQRFPVVEAGKLSFDNQSYRLDHVSQTEMAHQDGIRTTIQRIRLIEDKRENLLSLKSLDLSITTQVRAGHTGQAIVRVLSGSKHYSASFSLPQRFWLENDERIVLNINNLILKDDSNPGESRVLLANINIPKITGQIMWNSQPLTPRDNAPTSASADNDRKFYQVALGQNGSGITLKIIHELKGHVSLSAGWNPDKSCGDRQQVCAGLSVDADQKTYRFNRVKLGDDVLNGTLYIPGVFE